MSKKKTTDNANEPDIEDFAVEVVAAATDTDEDTSDEPDEIDSNAITFPLTRTFTHCDSTGREIANVSVTATVTLTRVNGVALSLNEIERRFRRNFYLSFKGGKAGLKELSAMLGGSSNSNYNDTTQQRPRRTMSPEHKQKLQEARQRRADGNRGYDDETNAEIVKLATKLLTGFSDAEWFGKAACLAACRIDTIEPASWSLAIRHLLDTDQIEARGEKRGREYRRVKNAKAATATTMKGAAK